MNYTDVFGAQTVPPSEESYVFHNLSGTDNQLYWPEQYSGAGYRLADITELTGVGAVAVRLPVADAVSVGESFLLRNRCLDDIQVNDASGAPAALLPAGQTLFFYVVDNTTPAGQWQIFTFGAGTSAADAVALAGDGLSVATGRLRVSSEYRAINSSYPIVADDRGQILDVVTGTITVTTPDATAAGDGFYCFIRNSSAGNLTLEGHSTQTVNGALSITFAPGDSVILMSTGTNWVTVGYGRSVSGQFSEVIVNAAAGDVTLSSSDVAGRMIRVAGTATTNITVTLPAIDNIYFVVVEAGMGAYNATFTTGSGATTILTASQRTVLTSDGTNVLAAVTTTVTSSLALVDGSAVAPSIGFSLDPDTGLFRKGNNVIGVAAGGAEVGSFGSSGFVGNVTGNVTGNVAGNVAGNVTGNVSGNAGTVTNGVYTTGNQTIGGTKTFSSPIVGSITGNAGTATKLATARSISLAGGVTGSASFDGSANISITATVADDSHNHTIANVDGLQTALDGKAASSHNHDAGSITSGTFSIDRIPTAVRNLSQGSNSQDPNLAVDPVILTNHANSPSASYWYITTTFYSTISSTSNKAQIAVQYYGGSQVYARSCYEGVWTAWQRLDNAGIPSASTSAAGIVQLSTSTSSTSTTLAATASAVKAAYDLANNDAASSKAENGYVKLQSGVIIQWGVATASEAGTTVTFPIAFPTACRSVTATYASSGDKISMGASALGTTTFKLHGWAYSAYWIAIGY